MKRNSQKGSIAIFVLIALLFYIGFLLLLYANNLNKAKTIEEKAEVLKNTYEKNVNEDSINDIYNKNKGVQAGDYVNYTPTPTTLTSESQIIKDLKEYSGYTGTEVNTESTITQEKLKWRVLDIQKDGTIKLISDKPTESKIGLKSYDGYNNAVYLLDEVCSTLYSGNNGKARSLKIEDLEACSLNIQKPTENDIVWYKKTNYKTYPKIFEKEKNGYVDEKRGEEYDFSEQTELIKGIETAKTSITVTHSYGFNISNLKNDIYYDLFIGHNKNYLGYWLSSRAINQNNGQYPWFCLRIVNENNVSSRLIWSVDSSGIKDLIYCLRPVVTLNADVKLVKDTETDTWNIE